MNAILFFNGWGMDDSIHSHMKVPENYDFFSLTFPYDFDFKILKEYEKVYFIGWSFGVFYMADFISKHQEYLPEKIYTVSINGIPHLMEKENLNKRVIVLTYKNLDEKNLNLFYKKIGIENFHSKKSISDLRDELKYFTDNYYFINQNCIDKAFISDNDLIIKSETQKIYYKKHNIPFVEIEGTHYIFHAFDEWKYFLGEI